MQQDELKGFAQAVSEDNTLQSSLLNAKNADDVSALAKEAGFRVSPASLLKSCVGNYQQRYANTGIGPWLVNYKVKYGLHIVRIQFREFIKAGSDLSATYDASLVSAIGAAACLDSVISIAEQSGFSLSVEDFTRAAEDFAQPRASSGNYGWITLSVLCKKYMLKYFEQEGH